jgi:hypothetical protein
MKYLVIWSYFEDTQHWAAGTNTSLHEVSADSPAAAVDDLGKLHGSAIVFSMESGERFNIERRTVPA